MRRFYIIIFILVVLFPNSAGSQEMDRGLFKPSSMVSLATAKKEMKQVYSESGETKTLHCGCYFDKQLQVYPNICDQAYEKRRSKATKKILRWVHAMPASAFAGSMGCWKNSVCTLSDGSNLKGPDCCAMISPKFKSMESDMHNLIPTIDMSGAMKDNSSSSSQFGGMAEYQICMKDGVVSKEPEAESRGNLARAYMYMSLQYKIRLPDDLEDDLRAWHLEDPPDAGEEKRNSLIELVQGNRNPFIDHPEIVERVRNF